MKLAVRNSTKTKTYTHLEYFEPIWIGKWWTVSSHTISILYVCSIHIYVWYRCCLCICVRTVHIIVHHSYEYFRSNSKGTFSVSAFSCVSALHRNIEQIWLQNFYVEYYEQNVYFISNVPRVVWRRHHCRLHIWTVKNSTCRVNVIVIYPTIRPIIYVPRRNVMCLYFSVLFVLVS